MSEKKPAKKRITVQEVELYTVRQVAELLDMHPETIKRHIRAGQIKATKLSEKSPYKISKEELHRLLGR